MYVNCCDANQNGIPPGGKVTITLPLYSKLTDAEVDYIIDTVREVIAKI